MFNLLNQALNEARRLYEYDYIFIDGLFLSIWLILLIKYKKWNALKFGLLTGFIIYIIDAVIWFNLPAGSTYPPGTRIREYWIGGIKVPQYLGEFFWPKFGCDFMMTISYALFIFSWIWIMFENFIKKNLNEIIIFTSFLFGAWLSTPFLSFALPINDTIVESVRHMDTQMIIWTINLIVGYSLLIIIYGTDYFNSKKSKVILYILVVACSGSFFMEFSLLISGIRSTGIGFLLYEVLFLLNQGIPYLYILYDIVFPYLGKKLSRREIIVEIENVAKF